MNLIDIFLYCILPLLLITLFSLPDQKKFGRLYKEKIDSDEAFSPQEINKKYKGKKDLFYQDSSKMFMVRMEIFWRDYQDKEMNRLAKRIRLYFILMLLVMFFNALYFWSLV